MRTLKAVVALVLGMTVYAVLPTAAEEKADQPAQVEQIQDLHLTEAQEAKIADIHKEYKPKVQEAAKELAAVAREEVEKLRAVLTQEQKTKLAAHKEERREIRKERLAERIAHLEELDLTETELAKVAEIRKEYQPKIHKALEGLKGLLNDDQRKAREEGLKAGKTRVEILKSLNLTGEQKEKMEAVGKEMRTLVREETEKMRDVLTESQKEKIQDLKEERREHARHRMAHTIANLKDLNLTEEQKTQIMDIRKTYHSKVHEAGNKLRTAVREEMDAILAVLKS